MKKGIIVAGSIIVDNICEIGKYPQKGNLAQVNKINKALGGLVPNVGIDLKRIDPTLPVFACGLIGEDENGKFVLDTLKKEGLDVSLVTKKRNLLTSVDYVMSEIKGERTFFAHPGANDNFEYTSINFDSSKVQYLHLGYFLFMKKIDNGDGLKILKKACKSCIKTSIDLISDEDLSKYKNIIPCLKYTDYLIINELEACRLCGLNSVTVSLEKLAKKLKSMGVRDKVIIHTPKLSCIYDGFEYLEYKPFKLSKEYIKGTTGAGDAFCAGALYQIMNREPNINIIEFATMCAAKSLGSSDAISSMVSKQEIINFCAKLGR